ARIGHRALACAEAHLSGRAARDISAAPGLARRHRRRVAAAGRAPAVRRPPRSAALEFQHGEVAMDDDAAVHGVDDALTANARDLERELEWFAAVLDARLKAYFGSGAERAVRFYLPPPSLEGSTSPYARFIRQHQVQPPVRLIVLLALIPHIRPQLL